MEHTRNLRDQNIQAAAMISEGKHKEAYQVLQRAMNDASRFAVQPQRDNGKKHKSFCVTALIAGKGIKVVPDAMFQWPLLSLQSGKSDEDGLGSISSACAVVLFNMGLACHHSSQESGCSVSMRNRLLAQAENLYLQAFEVGMYFDIGILNVALSVNLMEISFERGDLTATDFWSRNLSRQTKKLPQNLQWEIWALVWKADLYYGIGLVAARAA